MKALVLALALAAQQTADLPPAEEARAPGLMRAIRCMGCSGDPILDSNAPMALDMRRFVREQVAVGRDNDDVRQALTNRFGHEVLLRPVFDDRTALLWFTPALLLAFGGVLLFGSMKRRRGKV